MRKEVFFFHPTFRKSPDIVETHDMGGGGGGDDDLLPVIVALLFMCAGISLLAILCFGITSCVSRAAPPGSVGPNDGLVASAQAAQAVVGVRVVTHHVNNNNNKTANKYLFWGWGGRSHSRRGQRAGNFHSWSLGGPHGGGAHGHDHHHRDEYGFFHGDDSNRVGGGGRGGGRGTWFRPPPTSTARTRTREWVGTNATWHVHRRRGRWPRWWWRERGGQGAWSGGSRRASSLIRRVDSWRRRG